MTCRRKTWKAQYVYRSALFTFLAQSQTLQQVLDTVAEWINRIFESDRTSITLYENSDYLKVYSFSGNKAIPADFLVPIDQAFVGRVFKNQQLIICDDVSQSDELDCVMLTSSGMGTCMDAPLMHGQMCLGTLNVAHHQTHFLYQGTSSTVAMHCQLDSVEHCTAYSDHENGAPRHHRRSYWHSKPQRVHASN